ncbi:MFS transporter [Lapidilactobacillus bayanensis]|uniref:MFS transporter n=1 Tax=Lapidilactobacillus bayanensis TaxID=2485998 RepID=UPI000F7994ED|nr:MFS transporter [Lapidilactobacillus bayanensis]
MTLFFRLNRNLQLRMLTAFLSVLVSNAIMPNMTIYYARYFGAGITGILLIVASTLGFIAGLYGGHLADVYGRRPILLIGSWLMCGGVAVAALSNSPLGTNPITTFVGFICAQVGGNFSSPADQAMVIDLTDGKIRHSVYAILYWIMNVSVMIGAALGGWFFRDYLFELLLALLITSLIDLGIIQFFISETFIPVKNAVKGNAVLKMLRSYATVFVDTPFVFFLLSELLVNVIMNQPGAYLAVHLGNDFHSMRFLGLEIYGQRMLSGITLINTVMIVTSLGFFTKLTQKLSLFRAYVLGLGIQATGYAAAFVLNDFWPLVLCAVYLTVGEMILVPSSQTLRADLMNPEKIGAYSGAFSATGPLSAILSGASVSLSVVLGNWGMASLMLVIALIAILAINQTKRLAKTQHHEDE